MPLAISPRACTAQDRRKLNALLIDSRMDFQGNAVTITSKWTLSDDGKSLTVNTHFASPMGEGDTTMVYEKK